MAFFFLAGIIPAVFIVSFGRFWRPVEAEPGSYPSWARFVAIFQILLIGIMILVTLASNDIGSLIAFLILPAVSALLAESLLYAVMSLSGLALHREVSLLRWPAALLLSVPLMLAALGWLSDPYYVRLILYGGGLLAFAWLDWERLGKWRALPYLSLLVLLLMAVWRADTRNEFLFLPPSLARLANFLVSAAIGLGCIVLFRILGRWLNEEGFPNFKRLFWLALLVAPILLLEAWLGGTISAWDVATDGLGGIFMSEIVAMLGIGAVSLLAWRLPEKRLSAAYAATFVLPIIMLIATNLGTYGPTGEWGQVPHIRTERRAALIDRAIKRYRQDHGSYPQALSALTPGYLLYLPTPFIIPRQDWCYQGGEDYYRLGYVNREYFSTPTSVEVHASAGQPPDDGWNCFKESPP